MSDGDVMLLIEELERCLEQGDEIPDRGLVMAWHRRFVTQVDAAERGRDWPEILRRAKLLADRLDEKSVLLKTQLEMLRRQLEAQSLGRRALKGYRSANG